MGQCRWCHAMFTTQCLRLLGLRRGINTCATHFNNCSLSARWFVAATKLCCCTFPRTLHLMHVERSRSKLKCSTKFLIRPKQMHLLTASRFRHGACHRVMHVCDFEKRNPLTFDVLIDKVARDAIWQMQSPFRKLRQRETRCVERSMRSSATTSK